MYKLWKCPLCNSPVSGRGISNLLEKRQSHMSIQHAEQYVTFLKERKVLSGIVRTANDTLRQFEKSFWVGEK